MLEAPVVLSFGCSTDSEIRLNKNSKQYCHIITNASDTKDDDIFLIISRPFNTQGFAARLKRFSIRSHGLIAADGFITAKLKWVSF